MSVEKKNKGRSKESIENDSTTSRLVQKFLEMNETDYMRTVLIPVLEKEGYLKIDYHHGQNEIGKDIIFYKNDSFSRRKLVLAVVKTEKITKSASGGDGFPTILTQVLQATSNKVISWDGSKRAPDEVLVILADDSSHDIIASNPGLFEECSKRGMMVIQGSEIAESLLRHRRDIAEQILQSKLDTVNYLSSHPTNLPLLHALSSVEAVDIESIFTDLDASVGSTSMTYALSLRASTQTSIAVKSDEWECAKNTITSLENAIGKILKKPLGKIEEECAKANKKANSSKNRKIWEQIELHKNELNGWCISLKADLIARELTLQDERVRMNTDPNKAKIIDKARDYITDLKRAVIYFADYANLALNEEGVEQHAIKLWNHAKNLLSRFEDMQTSLQQEEKSSLSQKKAMLGSNPITELRKMIAREVRNCRAFVSESEKCVNRASQYVPTKKHHIEIDPATLNAKLDQKTDYLIHSFNSPDVSKSADYAKKLLEDTKSYLSAIEAIASSSSLSGILSPQHINDGYEGKRIGACILGLLDSGIDVLVTGNAGSGKSTTLDMFARRCSARRQAKDEILFLPLAKVVAPPQREKTSPSLEHFCDEVARLFKVTQPGITSQYVSDRLKDAKRVILILDGIDEADDLIPWLSALINELKKSKECVQVVASSRFSVPELELKGFFNIELLPFKPGQVLRFIRDFLKGDEDLAEDVVRHLKENPNMFDAAKTPLMSTILCVLARNGVRLPSTKNALYKERFELLWGAYDAKKQIQRVKSRKVCLEDISKKAAYYLHVNRVRSASRDHILGYTFEHLDRKYKPEVIAKAFEELERPCNVLLVEPDKTLGFGHLSYQEYLVSEELYSSRQSEIVQHLRDPWWRGVLVLAAMKADDIGTVLEDRITSSGKIGDAKDTLKAMIEVCSPKQKNMLQRLLDNHRAPRITRDFGVISEPSV